MAHPAAECPTVDVILDEDSALRAIVEAVEAETGERFFRSLVRHMSEALRVEYAFVSELLAVEKRFRTLAVWGHGELLENFELPVAGTPCEGVLRGEMAHHPERLQELFPQDKGLVRWHAESYCGVPLLDAERRVVGHLAIFDTKPMRDPRGLSILRIFAARARAEVERKRIEEALRESEERLAQVIDSAPDAILVTEDDGVIRLFNPAAEKVFRCAAADAIGTSVSRFGTPQSAESLGKALADIRAGRKTFSISEPGLKSRRADGEEFEFEGTLSSAAVGGRRLWTIIIRDLEERRRAEAEQNRLRLHSAYLQDEIKAAHNFEAIIGDSRPLSEALGKVDLVGATDSSVLVLGETGTGKELIARAVHAKGRRRERPLIKVNCAALPTSLIESELFGHERGAFTGATERRMGRFELADGGTIFLDEIGEIPLEVQTKLLRVLQERELERVGGAKTIRVDVRVIAATNRDLAAAVAAGTFRQDLYFRLNVFPIEVPPLRDRREDVPLLVRYFVGRYAAKVGRRITRVPDDVMRRLVAYHWPGNIRELENIIERAVILSPGPELSGVGELGAVPALSAVRADLRSAPPPAAASGGVGLDDVERGHILSVLKQTGWRIDGAQGAAEMLRVNPSTLRSRMKKLGLRRSHDQA